MLVELGLVEQRYKAVLEVLEGAASVTDVARRYGVGRQTVHKWLRHYATSGLAGLVDKSSKPDTCPHQMPPHIEARVLEMRRLHPEWGPRTILSRCLCPRIPGSRCDQYRRGDILALRGLREGRESK